MANAHDTGARRPLYRVAVCLGGFLAATCQIPGQSIVIDQLGYRPNDPKIAFIRQGGGGNFEVKDISANKTVFAGRSGSIGKRDPATGDGTFMLDFSSLKTPGTYRVWLPDAELASPEFRIDQDVFTVAGQTALQSFYYQRCGTAVKNGTEWQHPP